MESRVTGGYGSEDREFTLWLLKPPDFYLHGQNVGTTLQ